MLTWHYCGAGEITKPAKQHADRMAIELNKVGHSCDLAETKLAKAVGNEIKARDVLDQKETNK